MSTSKINTAIQECLNNCRDADSPVARLALYCVELRQKGWNESEIRTVETAVVRLLSGIIAPDEID